MTSDLKRELLAQKLRQRAAPLREEYPVSQGQSALLFLNRLLPRSPAYNLAFVARVVSEVDVGALGRALQRLVDRHATLRTIYPENNGSPCQIICGTMDLELTRIDASGWTDAELEGRVRQAFAAPYDLARGPVFRTILYSRSPEDHVLLFGIHHIATDGWSQGIILEELQKLYAACREGRSADLPPIGMSYADTVRLRYEALEGKKGEDLWAYWKKALNGDLPSLDLPRDFPRPSLPSMEGDFCPITIDAECYRELKSLARTEGVSFFSALLAAFQILLMRYSGKDDILVGTATAARSETEFERVVGYFVNSVVIRGDLSGEPSFRQLLRRFREVVLGALSHQDFPFSSVVEKLRPVRDVSRSPIFQVMFNLLSRQTLGSFADLLAGDETSESVDFGGMRLKPFPLVQQAGAFDLTLELVDTGVDLKGFLMYSTDLFRKETIARMAEHFRVLLEGVVRSPEQPINRLPLLTGEEMERVVRQWNATAAEYPREKCVHQLVREQACKSPDAVAVVCDGQRLSYGQLMERVGRLSRHLQGLGVGAEKLVGICMERSVDMVVAILSVLEAGAAYVPLDPGFPAERLALMVGDAECPVILTQGSLMGSLPHVASAIVDVVGIKLEGGAETGGSAAGAEDLAYVMYTSGSTGKPKGVEIPHRAVVNFLCSMQREPGLTASDNLLSVTTISFDIFGLELFLPLITGACTTIVKREVALDGRALLREMEKSRATVMQATPATWRLLLDSGWKRATGLKVLCGGEALSRELADRILETGAELWNMYGPTETTIWSAVEKVQKNGEPISIGRPIANTQLHVLDAIGNPLPIGVPGELHIGGHGLARGYRGRSDQTMRSFIPDPFGEEKGARLYRTGDLVRRDADGTIKFLGRIDTQVKIRGYRIELGDIEFHLNQHPDIQNSVVTAQEDKPEHKRLVAYYVLSGHRRPGVRELREHLAGALPDYMIPAVYICLDEFPLTPNSKIDRKALPMPDAQAASVLSDYVAPRDETENEVASIWGKVLGIRQVSIKDDFFDLGGDSLLAARLFAEIGSSMGHDLPLATLFRYPTIEGIAKALRVKDTGPLWSIVVPIQAKGLRPPLFLVHGAEGNVLLYRSLQRHLGDDQPVYGLQSEGLDGRAEFRPTIESMAAKYVEAIKRIRPKGPYYLGGYCMGGTVALEMAQQLRREGDKVALLAMFETYNPESGPEHGMILRTVHRLQNMVFHLLSMLSLQAGDRSLFLSEKGDTARTRLKMRSDDIRSQLRCLFRRKNTLIYRHAQVSRANDDAHLRYRPQRYDGRLILFRPKVYFARHADWNFGWEGIPQKGIDLHVLPFYPRTMVVEPFVRILAERLKECARRAEERS